ncbi:oligopeptide transport system substrate-binding protein [Maritalea mobilis]|uniref:Oligopeptide transport system substrate-binding protein n=1 Tax=Maritalea mobilis TaxID=483324 RepID=A0A4R6VL30_9HYPH|nr:peptide ABC transporter substrate-binding protein [Maritalea mobilis]TDQ64379.1 oligopeptide transport system substrate-binding protein [Maritalea mobilis]
MNFSKLFKTVSLGALLAAGLTMTAHAAGTHPETGEQLAEEQVFTYRLLDGIPSLDPQMMEDTIGFAFSRDLFEGLLNQDADGNLIPGVAKSWDVNETNDVYTFHLRDDAKWSNGDPVTAHDFVYAWQRSIDPELASPYAWYVELMALENASEILAGEKDKSELGVRAVDDLTFEVRLTTPLPYFASMTVLATVFPVHKATVEAHGTDWTQPENMVSNGAYKLTEWVLNERTVRERNPYYWNNDKTIIDKVVTHVISEENVAFTRYNAGELDMTAVPSGQFIRLKAERPDETLSLPYLGSYYYSFNMAENGPEAFKDVNVRKALSYAVDRKVIVENILQGGQREAYNVVPLATAGFTDPDTDYGNWTQEERDEKARELLAEAGYGPDNPLEFKLLYNTSETHKKIATAIVQMWKQKLNVNAELNNMEWRTMLETARNDEFDMVRYAWIGDYNEASTFLDLYTSDSPQNWANYENPEVDQMMADAKVSSNPGPIYTDIEKILARDMPVIPIYHYTSVIMLNTQVKGWPMNNIQQNWYSRDLYKVAQ